MPAWTVELKESVIDDLRALGIKQGRAVLKEASARLAETLWLKRGISKRCDRIWWRNVS